MVDVGCDSGFVPAEDYVLPDRGEEAAGSVQNSDYCHQDLSDDAIRNLGLAEAVKYLLFRKAWLAVSEAAAGVEDNAWGAVSGVLQNYVLAGSLCDEVALEVGRIFGVGSCEPVGTNLLMEVYRVVSGEQAKALVATRD